MVRSFNRNRGRLASLAVLFLALSPVAAHADTSSAPDWAGMLSTAAGSLQTEIIAILPVVLGIIVLFLGVSMSVRWLKKASRTS